MTIRGHYDPPVTLALPPSSGATVEMALAGCDDSMATAVYRFHEVRESSKTWLWRLHHIEEWLLPMSPQEKAKQFTDAASLPPLTPDGRRVFDAIQRRREQEWRESEAQHG